MREILFKAKRTDNGEWVEGYLFRKYYQELPHDRLVIQYKTMGNEYEWTPKYMVAEIDENTICQYTGLTDKKGNKIWENDIVKDTAINLLGSVEYDEEHGMYVINEVNDGYQNFQEFWSCTEVVGNIFDNPELLNN